MIRKAYDALLLDIDGTLVDETGAIPGRLLDQLQAAHERGVRVMLATGRSEGGTIPILRELGFETPAVVFNGAAVYCPVEGKMLEERILSNRAVERALAFARSESHLPIVMRFGAKFALHPRTADEERALAYLEDLATVPAEELPTESIMRVTLFSARHPDSADFEREVERAVDVPLYLTHFPLSALADQRDNPLAVVDLHPPCRGKAEALRVLYELYQIPPERVVAVGDASNDVPMLEAAGLGVAMETGMADAVRAADRLLPDNGGDALSALVDELFL